MTEILLLENYRSIAINFHGILVTYMSYSIECSCVSNCILWDEPVSLV